MRSLRGLIGKVAVTPLARRGQVGLELHGDLATIFALAQAPEQTGPAFVVSMVAGEGLEPPTRVQAMPKLVVQCRERARSGKPPAPGNGFGKSRHMADQSLGGLADSFRQNFGYGFSAEPSQP